MPATRKRCLQHNSALLVNYERNEPCVVMEAKDEVALVCPMGMLDDVEIASFENLLGDLFEGYQPLGLQPIVLLLVPDEVHLYKGRTLSIRCQSVLDSVANPVAVAQRSHAIASCDRPARHLEQARLLQLRVKAEAM